jgi:DNA-binding NarL/FixJ family response regulator
MAVAATIDDRAHEARIPRIVVALAHPTMRRYLCDLIEQGCRCWLATTGPGSEELAETVAALCPDVVVIDTAAFSARGDATPVLPARQMLVIGSEPDAAYRQSALRAGAGGWVGRDHVATELLPEIRRMLEGSGCECHRPIAASKAR